MKYQPILLLLVSLFSAADLFGDALETSGVKGGLVVCVGADALEQISGHWGNERYVVQCLENDPVKLSSLRKTVQAAGVYGRVTVNCFDGRQLPYADNLVNLVIQSSDFGVPSAESKRVMTPNGVAIINQEKLVKPWTSDIDDWPHYLHGADGNAVANDDTVGPPRQLQWMATPQWSRHHEHMASMNALVSSNGRVFCICDMGSNVSMLHPPNWKLMARDAFNGLLLWEQPIDEWFNHLHPLKSGPASLPRRLVADDTVVYATLGIRAPVSALDAVTGKIIRTYAGTEDTQEILLSNGLLFLVRGTPRETALAAVHPESGKILWERKTPIASLTLAADQHKVVCFDGAKVIALNRDDGTELWASDVLGSKRGVGGRIPAWTDNKGPRLILSGDTIVVSPSKTILAFSADSGKRLWSAPHPGSGYQSPKDLFVIDGLVWCGETSGAQSSGRMIGYDLSTGEIQRSFLPDKDVVWLSHHRCHISKATKNYIITGRMGLEFVDLNNETWQENHWIRGGCLYGAMPCNGLLYAPPHACACYFEAKQHGFVAMTGKSKGGHLVKESRRLEKGPAYSAVVLKAASPAEADWPVFRHDAARSGNTRSAVPANLDRRWSVDIGGKLTQPVIAEGRLYVASVDEHALYALDAKTGERKWRFTAGARIDSPPSLYRGLVCFGSRDGWIYCLRDRDGELVWRYRAVPRELLLTVYGQLESAWPVHGSVLIQHGEIHCVAGRNMFLDGGLRYLRLDPLSGSLISETVMGQGDPLAGGSIQQHDSWLDMTTTLPDVLSSDGNGVYMRSLPFDLEGKRRRINHIPDDSEPAHLFSPTGFLDDNWFHRSYWTFARSFPGGWVGHLNAGRFNPSGRLLVVDDSTIYGFGRQPAYYNWTTSLEYRLFAAPKPAKPTDIFAYDKYKAAQQAKFPRMKTDKQLGLPFGTRAGASVKSYDCAWADTNLPVLVTAMVGTKDHLFAAGPRDISDEGILHCRHSALMGGYSQKKPELEKQADLWTGTKGAMLLRVAKNDGRIQAEYRLEALPAFDGMVAAQGRLYLSLRNGTLQCWD